METQIQHEFVKLIVAWVLVTTVCLLLAFIFLSVRGVIRFQNPRRHAHVLYIFIAAVVAGCMAYSMGALQTNPNAAKAAIERAMKAMDSQEIERRETLAADDTRVQADKDGLFAERDRSNQQIDALEAKSRELQQSNERLQRQNIKQDDEIAQLQMQKQAALNALENVKPHPQLPEEIADNGGGNSVEKPVKPAHKPVKLKHHHEESHASPKAKQKNNVKPAGNIFSRFFHELMLPP